jgi:hypothetical protein
MISLPCERLLIKNGAQITPLTVRGAALRSSKSNLPCIFLTETPDTLEGAPDLTGKIAVSRNQLVLTHLFP